MSKVSLSGRGKAMPASPIRKLVPYADAAKARGLKVYHLNIGQPDIETPAAMIEAYGKLDSRTIEYGPSQGIAPYVKALCAYYGRRGIELEPGNVVVTTGGSEAIVFALEAIGDAGDQVIVPEPFYTNYNGFAVMAGMEIVPVTSRAENGFALPPRAEIEARIGKKTRAIMFSNPGNPTGAVYGREEMETLGSIAIERGLYLISDEAYREFVYDGFEHTSVMKLRGIEDRAILIDSISKQLSACGARVGCIASRNKDLMAAMLRFGQARLCPPTVDQKAAIAGVGVDDSYYEKVRAEYVKRRDLVCDAVLGIPGAVCQRPRGAFYTIAKLPIDDCEAFAVFLLEEFSVGGETVMVAPASGFYATPGAGKDEVRIAYVLECGELEKAMRIFGEGLRAYNAKRKP